MCIRDRYRNDECTHRCVIGYSRSCRPSHIAYFQLQTVNFNDLAQSRTCLLYTSPTGDPFTLTVVAVPLYLLYELSILMIKDKKTDDEAEEVEDVYKRQEFPPLAYPAHADGGHDFLGGKHFRVDE